MKSFDVNLLTPIKVKTGSLLFYNDSVEFIRDAETFSKVLAQTIIEGDKEAFHELFSGFINVMNKKELARKSKVPIATIRRMAARANFNIDNMLKVTSVICKELTA